MDTLTHALSGALAGRLLAPRPSPGSTPAAKPAPPVWQAVAAGAAAAAFPDLDFVLGYVSDIAYLRGHRGVTHSLLLLPLWGMLLAWVFAAVAGRHQPARPGWRTFYGIACAAILIHIAGDLITQFGTMIFAPLSDRRFGLGTTFIIDLVLTGLLVAGLVASAFWRRSKVPAAVALALVTGWVGVGAVGRGEAIEAARAYAAEHDIEPVVVDAAPRPASPFNWTAILFDGARYHYAHLNTRRSEVLEAGPDDNFIRRLSAPYKPVALAQWETRPKFGGGDVEELAREVWAAEEFAFYRWFAMFPVFDHAEITPPVNRCAGFGDLRFEIPGRGDTPFRYGLCGRAEGGEEGTGWRLYELVTGGRRWIELNY